MAQSTAILSRTLQSITHTKIRELEKQRARYEESKAKVISSADPRLNDQRQRIAHLYQGVSDICPGALADHRIKNIRHWLEQSEYDASISSDMLQSHEDLLRSTLDVQTRKLGLAHLYTQLVTEWMAKDSVRDDLGEDSDFENIDRQKERLLELCDKFEAVVFEPLETDEAEITTFISALFENHNEVGTKLLAAIRDRVRDSGTALLTEKSPFDSETLDWTIKGLLAEDLLSDEKKSVLRDLRGNDVVLKEVADVLNVRLADLDNWNWEDAGNGVPVLPRQQLNGKYRIWMDEDVIQAMLIHYIGIRCCVFTREALVEFVSTTRNGIWKWNDEIPKHEQEKRRYYLPPGSNYVRGSIESYRRSQYTDAFFLSQLPKDVYSINPYDDEESSEEKARKIEQQEVGIKQRLLRVLAADAIIHRELEGEVAVLQSDLEWFGTGLSHTTIFTVLRFFGFPESIVTFIKKVLQAPLRMHRPGDPPASGAVRIRQRGVPMAHAIEKLIGELILFVMDLVVNQEAGMLLYRLHDDVWLCGEPQRCADAWCAMQKFAEVFGLQFNAAKTGSVYLTSTPDGEQQQSPRQEVLRVLPKGDVRVGHLRLDPSTGKWNIDLEQVSQHVAQLKKQLASCGSILEWIRTWNSCTGRFFSRAFGEPAPCFGVEHVESILKTHQTIQESLFGSPNVRVVQYVRSMLKERFGTDDIPDAFIVLPEELGGLAVRNPFIPALVARNRIRPYGTASEIMQDFFKRERDQYDDVQRDFNRMDDDQRIGAYLGDQWGDPREAQDMLRSLLTPDQMSTFMSFEDFTKWRGATSSTLERAYKMLVGHARRAMPVELAPTADLGAALRAMGKTLRTVDFETRWILAMYRSELMDKCGGWRLVEEEFLPLGVLATMRRQAVRWSMVL